jgi:NAD(P)-dependent dehydrogenase (short-subunit alcohol dehydrogenase family)
MTGDSSGLGRHFARVLAGAGAAVALAARRLERLREPQKEIEAAVVVRPQYRLLSGQLGALQGAAQRRVRAAAKNRGRKNPKKSCRASALGHSPSTARRSAVGRRRLF